MRRPDGVPLSLEGPDSGTLFLRADRLEGHADARGSQWARRAARSRARPCLPISSRTISSTQEIHGRGNVLLRQGNDFVSGPELTFKRDAETGAFESPRFAIGESGMRGDAERSPSSGPTSTRSCAVA